MDVLDVRGFFSYAHVDDTFGRLTNLQKDLCDEFQVISGRPLKLFFDRDSIDWGELWQKNIEEGIEGSSFFIPILSPSYFLSSACNQELNQFLTKVEHDGESKELFLPILWIDIQNEELDIDRELIERILKYQYVDLRSVRFTERGSGTYVRALNGLARRLFDANVKITQRVGDAVARNQEDENLALDENENAPGPSQFLLDSAADMNKGLEELTSTANEINGTVIDIGKIFNDESKKINNVAQRGGNTVGAFLSITKQMSDQLLPLSKKYEDDAKSLLTRTNDLDSKVRMVIEYWRQGEDFDEKASGIIDMCQQVRDARDEMVSFGTAVKDSQKLSRALYKPLVQIERATVSCIGAFDVIISWEELLN